MKPKNIFLTLLAATAVGFTMTGCDDNKNEENNILKPIAEHLVGRWQCEEEFQMNDKGEWFTEKEENGESGYKGAIQFFADGTMVSVFELSDGWNLISTMAWTADDATRTIGLTAKNMTVLTLTADRFVMGSDQAANIEEGETLEGQFKWTHTRMADNERTFCEKLVGKWVHSKSYEEVDGEWKETDFGIPDLGYFDLHGDGTAEMYTRFGDKEVRYDGLRWQSKENTSKADKGILKLINGNKQPVEMTFAVVDGNTVECYYEVNSNPATGEIRQGKFKDVLVRERK